MTDDEFYCEECEGETECDEGCKCEACREAAGDQYLAARDDHD